MSDAAEVVQALKRTLRARGITYVQVAEALGLSESSVKRLLAGGRLSLARLQQICDLAGVDLWELGRIAEEQRRNVDRLSEAQEQELVEDTKLLLVAFLLLNDWTFDQIVAEYEIAPTEGIRLLARLDRLKIIDLLPGNRVRMRLSRTFAWRHHGPIQRFFEERVQTRFFKSRFDGAGELRLVLNGMLSEQSNRVLQQHMRRLAAEFESLAGQDRRLALGERRGTTLIAAMRPWGLGVFEQYRRGEGPDLNAPSGAE